MSLFPDRGEHTQLLSPPVAFKSPHSESLGLIYLLVCLLICVPAPGYKVTSRPDCLAGMFVEEAEPLASQRPEQIMV